MSVVAISGMLVAGVVSAVAEPETSLARGTGFVLNGLESLRRGCRGESFFEAWVRLEQTKATCWGGVTRRLNKHADQMASDFCRPKRVNIYICLEDGICGRQAYCRS